MIYDIYKIASDFPWLIFGLAIFLGGSVKGALGVGLPLVAVPLLSFVLPSIQAIALMAIPVLMSNLWQACEEGNIRQNLRRFSGLITAQLVTTLLTVRFTLSLSAADLNIMLAASVILAVALMAYQPTLQISRKREHISGVGVGALSGMLGGISSLTGPVIITYLVALKLPRNQFIGSVSIIYLTGSLPLYAAMAWYGRFDIADLALSVSALGPMSLGLVMGKSVRKHLNESLFRKILLGFLTMLALLLVFK